MISVGDKAPAMTSALSDGRSSTRRASAVVLYLPQDYIG